MHAQTAASFPTIVVLLGAMLPRAACAAPPTRPATASPRERLLLDFNWCFKLGEPTDLNKSQFEFPEFDNLKQHRPNDEQVEAKNAALRVDAADKGRVTINADGEDVAIDTVATTDAQGRLVPVADNLIEFEVSGSGKIIGVGNGNPTSLEPDKARQRRLFNGLAQVIVQATRQPGPIGLTAISTGLQPATVTVQGQQAALRPAVP